VRPELVAHFDRPLPELGELIASDITDLVTGEWAVGSLMPEPSLSTGVQKASGRTTFTLSLLNWSVRTTWRGSNFVPSCFVL
jgi:hypothetical protein